jgi:hypothetical protein
LFRLFRPGNYSASLCLIYLEFVKLYSKKFGPLSPDAFSKFSRGTDTSLQDNAEIEQATKYLLEEQIPKCVKELEVFVSIDPFAFVEAFHRNGINLRHLGNVSNFISLQYLHYRHAVANRLQSDNQLATGVAN